MQKYVLSGKPLSIKGKSAMYSQEACLEKPSLEFGLKRPFDINTILYDWI